MQHFVFDYFQGLVISSGLIVAIGAQNIFVLTQAVRREHAALAAGIAMTCDVVLIAVGAFGIGGVIAANPALQHAATAGGAAFLGWFGYRALKASRNNQSLLPDEGKLLSWQQVALYTLAVSLLNPHVYLDTVVMIGTLSGTYPGAARYAFATGAMSASVLWFALLWLAGTLLAPIFRTAAAWKWLNRVVCLTVWAIGFGLVVQLARGFTGV